jgi:hypothetical protein
MQQPRPSACWTAGAEAIVAGCTEIPLALAQAEVHRALRGIHHRSRSSALWFSPAQTRNAPLPVWRNW